MHRSALLSSRCLHQKRRNDNTRLSLRRRADRVGAPPGRLALPGNRPIPTANGVRRLLSWCREFRFDRAGVFAVLYGHSLYWCWLGHGVRQTRFFCRTARHRPARQPGLADRRLLCRTRHGRSMRGSVNERNRHQPVLRGYQSRSRYCGHRRGALTGLTSTKGLFFLISIFTTKMPRANGLVARTTLKKSRIQLSGC